MFAAAYIKLGYTHLAKAMLLQDEFYRNRSRQTQEEALRQVELAARDCAQLLEKSRDPRFAPYAVRGKQLSEIIAANIRKVLANRP